MRAGLRVCESSCNGVCSACAGSGPHQMRSSALMDEWGFICSTLTPCPSELPVAGGQTCSQVQFCYGLLRQCCVVEVKASQVHTADLSACVHNSVSVLMMCACLHRSSQVALGPQLAQHWHSVARQEQQTASSRRSPFRCLLVGRSAALCSS